MSCPHKGVVLRILDEVFGTKILGMMVWFKHKMMFLMENNF
jgi:hypothetical protein